MIPQMIALSLMETRKNETMTLDTHRTDTGCIHQEVWTHRKWEENTGMNTRRKKVDSCSL